MAEGRRRVQAGRRAANPDVVAAVMGQVQAALIAASGRLVIIGICGAQGSGKSTLAEAVAAACAAQSLRSAVLSIDDLYLTHAARQRLARKVHPLLATRGVPGTHDLALAAQVFAMLERGEPVPLPRFDKLRDDRRDADTWPQAPAGCQVLLFEGWCIGARPQASSALQKTINVLERDEDPHGTWRRFANDALAGPYDEIFARIDRLVLLAAPTFEIVAHWRLEQERALAQAQAGVASMDATQVRRFVAHYERLTRHILAEMPDRADLVIRLDDQRRPLSITSRFRA